MPSSASGVELKEGRFGLVEKPKMISPSGRLPLPGKILEACASISPGRGELEITDAIQWLVDEGLRVEPSIVEGWWKDTADDVLAANHLILDVMDGRIDGQVCPESEVSGRVVVESGARIIRSTVRGPVVIGSGAHIEDAASYTAIAREVTVRGSEIENSILLDGSAIVDVKSRIDSSLLGRNARIEASSGKPQVTKLVLGDNSQIWTRS